MLCKVFWNKFLQSFASYGIIPLVGAQIYTEDSETVHRQHLAERTGLEPAAQLSRAPDFQSGRLPFAHLSGLAAIRDLQPRSDCHLKLQWCRLLTLHGRGYLPERFSTFPIGSVCDQSRIRTYAEVSLISFADCPFRPLAHLVI